MSQDTILIEKQHAVGQITFNRPEKFNAYNFDLSMRLKDAVTDMINDDSIKVILITGSGKAFMAGADISMINNWIKMGDPRKIQASSDEMFNPTMLEECPKPVIGVINGLAFGMGCEIALACDFRIASRKAKFALPEIKLGLVPGGGGSQRLLRLVGATRALEMISTGEPISAQTALEMGILNQVADPDDLWTTVESFTNSLTEKSPGALHACKKLIYQGGNLSSYKGLTYEKEIFSNLLLTEDALEGTQAFLEKRAPHFKGK